MLVGAVGVNGWIYCGYKSALPLRKNAVSWKMSVTAISTAVTNITQKSGRLIMSLSIWNLLFISSTQCDTVCLLRSHSHTDCPDSLLRGRTLALTTICRLLETGYTDCTAK